MSLNSKRVPKRRSRQKQSGQKPSVHSKAKRSKLDCVKNKSQSDIQGRVKTADLRKIAVADPISSSDEEGPSEYEKFMKSVSEDLEKKNIHINASKRDSDGTAAVDDDVCDGEDDYDEGGDDDDEGSIDKEVGSDDGDDDVGDSEVERSECEDDSDGDNKDATGVERENIECKKEPDPFTVHFEQDLSEAEVDTLSQLFAKPLHYQHSQDPELGGVSAAECLPSRTPQMLTTKGKSLTDLYVKKRLSDVWESSKDASFSPLQEKIFSIIASYKDLLFSRRTLGNGEAIRKIYLLHSLNHILKTRSTIMKNNARLSRDGKDMDDVRDQGLTRPKVLILLPFREAARRTVEMLISLLFPKAKGVVSNRKRFHDEYKEQDYIKSKTSKPASYEATFQGNIDDCFRLGITIKKNMMNLYSKFYSSDLIITSPLGLRTIIGAEGEKTRDYDFLSSLELVIIDQADIYVMQNWDHMLNVFDHTYLQPKESHGVDFSRILSNFTGDLMRKTLILIPSSLDFIQIRNCMTKLDLNFISVNEYTKAANISRARTKFFHGKTHFLLYTERLHFFRRFRIRGIHHIIFYSLPNYAEFYPELINLLEEAPVGGITCTIVYSLYDSLSLKRIVGTKQARAMLTAQDTLHTLYTNK